MGPFFGGGRGAGLISFFGEDFVVKLLTTGYQFWKIGDHPDPAPPAQIQRSLVRFLAILPVNYLLAF